MDGLMLEVVAPSGRQSSWPLLNRTLLIGRDVSCDVQIEGRDVSRHHCALSLDGERVLVRDLSTNGTFVGKQRILTETRLALGEELRIGRHRLRVVVPGRTGAPPKVLVEGGAELAVAPTGGRAETTDPGAATASATDGEAAAAPSSEGSAPAATGAPEPLADVFMRSLRDQLLDSLDLRRLTPAQLEGKSLADRVRATLDLLIDENARKIPPGVDRARLRKQILDEVLGLGPLEDYLNDPTVTEVMVVDRTTIYVEVAGRIELTPSRFSSDDALRSAIERIVTPLGRRIDESTPMVDARLPDGSRVNAIIPPLAPKGACLTIRKFPKRRLTVDDLLKLGSLDPRMARFLMRSVVARRNIVVSGGTGSGKTTLLNIISSAIPAAERIITIEDAAELSLAQPHVVTLETRPKNMEGKGEYTIRDLLRNALRMRPDRIIVGECRGPETLDMLQAMNTGHEGSLTTVHANSPEEAIARLETLVLMAGLDLPSRAIREQLASSIHVIVQQARFSDGSRRITRISEVVGLDDDGALRVEDVFEFVRDRDGGDGKVRGEFMATGFMPTYVPSFVTLGLVKNKDFL